MGIFNPVGKVSINDPLKQEHIGIVIDNNDPKNLCRVRVVIPGLLDVENEVWLTRATLNFPGTLYCTPALGQRVRVWFTGDTLETGKYGIDYVHKYGGLGNFKPGDYGFADLNSNMFRVRDGGITINTGIITLNGSLNVSGKLSTGGGATGSFTSADGRSIEVTNGIITNISEPA